MADLRELFAELGYTEVRTVLASGNVIFTGPKAKAREKLEHAIEEPFAMKVDVVVKTMAEIEQIVGRLVGGGEIVDGVVGIQIGEPAI